MKSAGVWSVFILSVVFLSFLLYPVSVWGIRTANDGLSSGYNPAGLYWSRPYTRFIPATYEPSAALATDLGASGAIVAGVFALIARRRNRA